MYDINKELDYIIIKYKLDKHYPQYEKAKKANEILKKIVNKLINNNIKTAFICSDELEILMFKHMVKDSKCIDLLLYKISDLNKLIDIDWCIYEEIYIVSFDAMEIVQTMFEQQKIAYKWIYDIFFTNDIGFQNDFYKFNDFDVELKELISGNYGGKKGWLNCFPLELYYANIEYETEKNEALKLKALEKCFFMAIVMKNFCLAAKYVNEMKKYESKLSQYFFAWSDIEKLLKNIKKILRERQQRDIIIYWLDAIAYGEEKDMPYLRNRMEKSTSFTNAFTVTPYTSPTARTMFCKIKQVDDLGYNVGKITDKNSQLLRNIKEQGYDYKVISGYLTLFDTRYISDSYHELLDTCSMIYWDMLQNLILSEKPIIILSHTLEAHPPCLSNKMDEKILQKSEICERQHLARTELDEQLAFYDNYVSNNAVRIYLSDHGRLGIKRRIPILFNVWEYQKKEKKINSLFSLIDFEKIIDSIIKQEELNEDKLAREFVEIQDVDHYNKKHIETVLKNKDGFLGFSQFGYKGVITNDYFYLYSSTGTEWVSKKDSLEEPELFSDSDDISEDKLKELRKLTGEYPVSVIEDDKFHYVKYMRNVYQNQKKYMSEGMTIITQLMDKYLLEFPNNSVAIRMGGYHSNILYRLLSSEAKAKIVCFIDMNPNCHCSTIGIPILTLQDALNKGIKGVILSSFAYIDMLRQETKLYRENVKVVDFYECLENDGIKCEKDFFLELMPDDVWDVGFPFEE